MSYGDGGFYFLQPVNNGYGAIGASYGATPSMKQTFVGTMVSKVPGVRALPFVAPTVNRTGTTRSAVEEQQKMYADLDRLIRTYNSLTAAHNEYLARLIAYDLSPMTYKDRLKSIDKIKAVQLDIQALVGKIRFLQEQTQQPQLLEYPSFEAIPPEFFLEQAAEDEAFEEAELPPEEVDPMAPPPVVVEPDFYEKNERTIMLVAGAVGAYALLRMLK